MPGGGGGVAPRGVPLSRSRVTGGCRRQVDGAAGLLAGAQQFRNIGRLLQGPVQPEATISRAPVQRADANYSIADPVDRRLLDVMKVVPFFGLNAPSFSRSQT